MEDPFYKIYSVFLRVEAVLLSDEEQLIFCLCTRCVVHLPLLLMKDFTAEQSLITGGVGMREPEMECFSTESNRVLIKLKLSRGGPVSIAL